VKVKHKDRHFDTNKVIGAESQAVLNTLTEVGFQDAFKNGRSPWKGTFARKGTTSRMMTASMPKIVFDQMAAPDPKIMDGSL
jgi:hypothetical protein